LFPAFDSGEDGGIGGPDQGLWIGVCVGDEAIGGGLEIVDGSEDTALEAPKRELGEEACACRKSDSAILVMKAAEDRL
jgi:hypothetical protein